MVVGGHRDSILRMADKYQEFLKEATPFRHALAHGVLTVDKKRRTFLHSTDGERLPLDDETTKVFLAQCIYAYRAATNMWTNAVFVFPFAFEPDVDVTATFTIKPHEEFEKEATNDNPAT